MKDKIALVTGAGSGLGRSLSLALVKKGYMLILVDISSDTLEESERSIKELGGEAISLVVDISDVELVSQTIEKLNAEVPQIDLLINCAGFSITSTCDQLSPLDWQRIIGVNLLGTIHLSTLVFRIMKVQGFGQIVNIASMFEFHPITKPDQVEIGYWLYEEFRQKGILSQVLPRMIAYTQTHINVSKIRATTAIENIPSQKLLEKCGFIWTDTIEYQIEAKSRKEFEYLYCFPTH